ncbi:hypothetical protein CDL12_04756 [Handroanthus impetiginosus]|uniref:Uncharacterized protein n=1 Tax=Handroanthus impetiginosus TaxID=429701 RepID=A0A2G9HYE0_9LAMI|nr:hypothetical protein CDL12_04756 [Handroanthus impetiginosus]
MWAALPLQPLKPWWPPNAISVTKPTPRYHSMAVHNSQNAKEIGGFGEAVINALKSDEPLHRNAVKLKIKKKPPPPAAAAAGEEEEEEKQELEVQQQQRQPSGADVLIALQRATAQKAKKIKEKREAAGTVPRRQTNGGRENQWPACFSNVRPLCIKPEWSGRLEELERRLDQLAPR